MCFWHERKKIIELAFRGKPVGEIGLLCQAKFSLIILWGQLAEAAQYPEAIRSQEIFYQGLIKGKKKSEINGRDKILGSHECKL